MPPGARNLAFVIRTFIRRDQEVRWLPPTICFDRSLAYEIAETDVALAEGVAVFEINLAASSCDSIGPVKVYGEIPADFRCVERRKCSPRRPRPTDFVSGQVVRDHRKRPWLAR
jgi:hypothetical protein